jgi:hypothetical protein
VSQFPPAKKPSEIHTPDEFLENPFYQFWFILKNYELVCCLEVNGTFRNRKGKESAIEKWYRKHHAFWPLKMESIGDTLA